MSQRSQPERACKQKRGFEIQSVPGVTSSSDSGVCESSSVGGGDSVVYTTGSIASVGDSSSDSTCSSGNSRMSLETVRDNMDG